MNAGTHPPDLSLNQYFPLLRRQAQRWGLSHHDAEDVAQETLCRAIKYLGTLARRENPVAWLFAIQANVLKDWHAATSRRLDCFGLEYEPSTESSEQETCIPTWLLPHLKTLTGAQGELVEAYLEENGQVPSIAIRLGVTQRTVHATLAKLRRRILDSLGWGDFFRFLQAVSCVDNPVVECLIAAKEHQLELIVWNQLAKDMDEAAVTNRHTCLEASYYELGSIAYRNITLFQSTDSLFFLTMAQLRSQRAIRLYKEQNEGDDANRNEILLGSIEDAMAHRVRIAPREEVEAVLRMLGC